MVRGFDDEVGTIEIWPGQGQSRLPPAALRAKERQLKGPTAVRHGVKGAGILRVEACLGARSVRRVLSRVPVARPLAVAAPVVARPQTRSPCLRSYRGQRAERCSETAIVKPCPSDAQTLPE